MLLRCFAKTGFDCCMAVSVLGKRAGGESSLLVTKRSCGEGKAIHPFFAKVQQSETKEVAGEETEPQTVEEAPTTPLKKSLSCVSATTPACADDVFERVDSTVQDTPAQEVDEDWSSSECDDELDEELKKTEAVLELWSHITDPGWKEVLEAETKKDYFRDLALRVKRERRRKTIYPPPHHVFTAFNASPFDKVKVVIIGQDPYHGPDQAHGLCFSVLPGIKPPPSLKNIYKELEADLKWFKAPPHGFLLPWANQGVLMLNATLTVRRKEANSHAKYGWQAFTDAAIRILSEKRSNIVFLLWGGFAQKKGSMINADNHKIIKTFHPSPLSVTKWRGCRVFSKANRALRELGHGPIDWRLPEDPNGTLEPFEVPVEESESESEEEEEEKEEKEVPKDSKIPSNEEKGEEGCLEAPADGVDEKDDKGK
eukprot:TRINITY_DN19541_c0_g1_i2.p1 TRINITY_DN19541_c0_g1~~TRINITY_DN19541_c0_g1_i2.p1  ORF type:complete len:426 (+),score=140.90 TRINITY_DN19541_c0_g1_i2:96-1373(+)